MTISYFGHSFPFVCLNGEPDGMLGTRRPQNLASVHYVRRDQTKKKTLITDLTVKI